MSPPRINRATKPKPIQGCGANVPQPSGMATLHPSAPNYPHPTVTATGQLVPVTVYIDPNHIEDLKEALLHFGPHARLATGEHHNEDPNHLVSQPPATNYQELRPCGGHNIPDEYPQFEELASSLSRLSTSTTSTSTISTSTTTSPTASYQAQRAPVILPSSTQASPMKMKYYVVLVGKCAGIFYDEWYPSRFASVTGYLMSHHYRQNVQSLIYQVPDARYKGFTTQSAAEEYYIHAKGRGMVRIVRNPGDNEKFGPMVNAIQ